MKVYDSDRIRNVAVVAHGGAGKTSLVEAMLFSSGVTKRLGRVDEGNTVTDYFPEEIKRKVTINAAMAPCEWREHKLNIIDTPGFSDFIGDVHGALRVVETALFVVCAVAGVEVQTEIIWDAAERGQKARVIYINKMDRENASFTKVLEELRSSFPGSRIVPVQLPVGEAEQFRGIVDILQEKALIYQGDQATEGAVPADLQDEVASYRLELTEAAAEADDELLMKYLDGGELTADEFRRGLHLAVQSGKLVPVLCGSALKNMAVKPLLDFLVDYAPSPAETAGDDAAALAKKPLAALVFKTIADPFVGKINYLRVFAGVLKSDSSVYNTNKEADERVAQLNVMQGKTQIAVPEAPAGDIVAVAKLQVTGTGDTLSQKQNPVRLEGIDFPEPRLTVAIRPKSKGDEDKLSNAVARLLEEDNTLRVEKNTETKELLLTGMGELHLDITLEKLQRKFGVEVESSNPRVPYRETIRGKAQKVEGKHKKQTGGHGQYGHVFIDMEPLPGEEFQFEEKIFGGAVPKQYIPAVEKGIREAMQEGILAGYPVTNIKVTLIDGSFHPVDSSEMAFKIAAGLAFRKAVEQAKPVLLEPIMNVEVTVPEQFMGDIIGDLNGKRGRVLGMEAHGRNQVIRAQVPLSEMYRYAIDLKSITQGRGSFRMEFAQYEEVPQNIAEKIIEAAKAERANA